MDLSVKNRFQLLEKFRVLENNIWVDFGQLAAENKPVNLGQGCADYAAPDIVKSTLAEVALANEDEVLYHQYTRGYGHPRLVKALSDLYSPMLSRRLDPMKEILVTIGAEQALYYTVVAHIEKGDEVIIIEPSYDSYESLVRMAGGTPVFIPLKAVKTEGQVSSADWKLDLDELASKFNKNTKMIFVNTPHNPSGKVFGREELIAIGALATKWNCLVVMDEVYEWLVYGDNKHFRMASLPGMFERTLTICSAGKSFCVTGWKLGWVYGPEYLVSNLMAMHSNCVFAVSTIHQEAAARVIEGELNQLNSPDGLFMKMAKEVEDKRNFLAEVLRSIGMEPVVPQGSFFMLAKWGHLANKIKIDVKPGEENDPRDYQLAKFLSRHWKIQMIPPSAFFQDEDKHLGEDYLRFCFIKKDTTLRKAAEILQKWKSTWK